MAPTVSPPTQRKPLALYGTNLLVFAGLVLMLAVLNRWAFPAMGLLSTTEGAAASNPYLAISTVAFLFAWGTKHGLTVAGWKQPKRTMAPKADDAVSPVIGTILMVAITVVLAITTYNLVSRLAPQEQNPSVSLQTTDDGQTFRVLAADPGLDWIDFTANPCTTIPTGPLLAGQDLTGCNGQVALVHTPTNRLLYSYG